jgi:hypothetical protein
VTADVASQLLACDITRGRSPSLLADQPSIEEASQVAARRGCRYIGLGYVGGSVGALEEALLESDDETIWPIALVHELLEVRPPHSSLSELPSAAPGWRYVCFNAEPYERRRIALRLK